MHIGQKNYKNPDKKKEVPSFRGRELRWQRLRIERMREREGGGGRRRGKGWVFVTN